MNFSRPFITRPIATSLLAAAIFLAGAAAYGFLPVAPLPRVDFPTINVSAGLPGASPETMASAVATPLERRFGRIAGLTEMTSDSQLGNTSITLQFDLDRDVESAAKDVQAAIMAAAAELPAQMPSRPTYRKVNPGDAPILIVSMTSDTLSLPEVCDAALSVAAQKIAQVEGVGQVSVGGGQQPAVRVQVDPVALAGADLAISDVREAIAQSTVDQPRGRLSGSHLARTIEANDQLFGAESFRPLIVAHKNGEAVRLGDVAEVIDGVENPRVAAWANGKRAVVMIVRRQPGANILETIDRVKALLPTLAEEVSPAIDIAVTVDRAQMIRASVKDVEHTLYLTIGLVILVVFLFLRSAAATAIPSVAVPISLVGTFAAMYFLDYSLDNLSLMALTISTGFVVDDAIVMTENVARYLELGEKPLNAALKGARQIGFTIISITLSLLAVFIPILMMGGIIGRLFRSFAVTLSVAIVVSAIVSLTLTPMMCAKLLKPEKEKKHGRAYRALERFFDAMLHVYEIGLRWVLRHEVLMLLVTLATVAVTVSLYVVIPKGLFPQQDTGMVTGSTEAAQDISFVAMRERQEQVTKIVAEDPDVMNVISFTGGGGRGSNTGSLFFDLRPKPERKLSADEVIARLRPKVAQIPGISLFLQAGQDVRIGGRPTRTQYQFTLQSVDLEELRAWAPKMFAKLKTLPALKDVATDQQTAGIEHEIVIDRDSAARLGVSARAIDDALYDAFGQRQVATTFTELNQYRVVLEVKPELQRGPEALDQIHVRSSNGGLVPLSGITTSRSRNTSLSISHQGQFPSVTLSFNLAPGVSLGEAVDLIDRAGAEIGMPATVRAGFAGTAQAFQDSLSNQPMLILFALLAVYIVLGILYESYIHPITIISTLPSAGVGALLALMLFDTELSIIALIGIILLIGIVKKNAIMMIDFAIEAERDQHLSPEEAIYQACVLRFRPITMTTMAALLAGLPLALGQGVGSELRRPLGIAIVGGLMFSQMLTLFTTPVVYLALERLSARFRKKAPRPEAAVPRFEPSGLRGDS